MQSYPRLLVCLIHKNELKCNYKELPLFWNIEETGIDEERKSKIFKNIKKGTFLPKLFTSMMPFTCMWFLYNVVPKFHADLPSYVPEQLHFKYLPYLARISIIIYEIIAILFILAFDMIIIYTCVYLVAELEVLSYKLEDVINGTEKDKRKKLIDLMQYHAFLLR